MKPALTVNMINRLVDDGFYYDSEMKAVACFSCKFVLPDLLTSRIEVFHLSQSPNCHFANTRRDTFRCDRPRDHAYTELPTERNNPDRSTGVQNKLDTDSETTSYQPRTSPGENCSQQAAADEKAAASNASLSLAEKCPTTLVNKSALSNLPSSAKREEISEAANNDLIKAAKTAGTAVSQIHLVTSVDIGIGSQSVRVYTCTPAIPVTARLPESSTVVVRYPVPALDDPRETPSPHIYTADRPERDREQLASALDMRRAISPELTLVAARMATFASWPRRGLPNPRHLVIAGFYCMGIRDSVRCFYCGVTLKNWREDDDAWETHVRFRFSCLYVISIKGEDFINRTLSKLANGGDVQSDRQLDSRHQSSIVAINSGSVRSAAISSSSNSSASGNSLAAATRNISRETVVPTFENSEREATALFDENSIGNVAPSRNTSTTATELGLPASSTNDLDADSNNRNNGLVSGCKNNHSTDQLTLHRGTGEWPRMPAGSVSNGTTLNILVQTDGLPGNIPQKLEASSTQQKLLQLQPGTTGQVAVTVASAQLGAISRPTSISPEHRTASGPSNRFADPQDFTARLQQLTEANRRLRQQRTCCLCGQRGVDTIFLPCGHLCTCESCAATIRNCCLCNNHIRGTAHVFLE